MLASSYSEKNISECVILQPKLDGIRCLMYMSDDHEEFFCLSRQGNRLTKVENFFKNNYKSFFLDEDVIYDGELYIHNKSFEEIVSIVKGDSQEEIEYHIYDFFSKKNSYPQLIRIEYLRLIERYFPSQFKLVESLLCDKKNIEDSIEKFIAQGYEGIIIRNPDGLYEQKRSKNLIKYKKFHDNEYLIKDIVEATGKDSGSAIFVCETSNGIPFNCRMAATLLERQEIFLNKKNYIGKLVTVTYQNLTAIGVPRFPVAKCIRDYE